jgi:hypothetical protein
MGRILRVLATVLAPMALAGGVAMAVQGDEGGRRGAARAEGRPHPPGPPFFARGLTFAEIHARRRGQDVVLRIDRGRVQSASADELTIRENNGDEVTIPVNGDTRVLAGPRRRGLDVEDLRAGTLVLVHRRAGQPADVVALPPRWRGRRHFGPRGFGPPGRRGWGPPGPPPGPPM